jgi:hypothetical protein
VRHVYTLQPGEDWALFKGLLIVIHPERPPKIIREDGTEEGVEVAQTLARNAPDVVVI